MNVLQNNFKKQSPGRNHHHRGPIGDPISLKTPIFSSETPIFVYESPIFSYENENIGVSDKKIWVSEENIGVSDEAAIRVSDEMGSLTGLR